MFDQEFDGSPIYGGNRSIPLSLQPPGCYLANVSGLSREIIVYFPPIHGGNRSTPLRLQHPGCHLTTVGSYIFFFLARKYTKNIPAITYRIRFACVCVYVCVYMCVYGYIYVFLARKYTSIWREKVYEYLAGKNMRVSLVSYTFSFLRGNIRVFGGKGSAASDHMYMSCMHV